MGNIAKKLKEIIDFDMRKENKIWSNEDLEFIKVKYGLNLSDGYEYYLKNYGNDYFKDDYYFIPSSSNNRILKDEFNLNGIFGLYDDVNNLEKNILANRDNLKDNLFPIADIPGGDLVCMDKTTGEIYFWFHDEPKDEDTYLVANSFTDFIDGFQYIKKEINTDGIEVNFSSKLDAAMRKAAEKYKNK